MERVPRNPYLLTITVDLVTSRGLCGAFFLGTSLFLRIECLCRPLSSIPTGTGFPCWCWCCWNASSISYLFSACYCLFILFFFIHVSESWGTMRSWYLASVATFAEGRCMTARDRPRAWDVNFFGSSNLTHKSCGIFVASWGFAHCIGTRLVVFHNFFHLNVRRTNGAMQKKP